MRFVLSKAGSKVRWGVAFVGLDRGNSFVAAGAKRIEDGAGGNKLLENMSSRQLPSTSRK
jgi:hypothetical protein